MVSSRLTPHHSIDYDDTLTTDQRFARLRMDDIRREHLEGWRVQVLSKWFPLYNIRQPVTLGTYTRSSKPIMTRWYHRDTVHLTKGGYASPTDLARDYLTYKYPDLNLRFYGHQLEAFHNPFRKPPLFAYPSDIARAVYIDIDAAYWTILRIVGWDVDYKPGKWLSPRSDNADYPYPHIKQSRNNMVSMALRANINMWDGEKLVNRKTRNKWLNDSLWCLVQDVLNGVASDMQYIGAVYGYTDGFIIPENKLDHAAYVMASWGLNSSVRHYGRGRVFAAGSYSIGGHTTSNNRRKPIPVDNVYAPYKTWLRKQMFFWSNNRGVYNDIVPTIGG